MASSVTSDVSTNACGPGGRYACRAASASASELPALASSAASRPALRAALRARSTAGAAVTQARPKASAPQRFASVWSHAGSFVWEVNGATRTTSLPALQFCSQARKHVS